MSSIPGESVSPHENGIGENSNIEESLAPANGNEREIRIKVETSQAMKSVDKMDVEPPPRDNNRKDSNAMEASLPANEYQNSYLGIETYPPDNFGRLNENETASAVNDESSNKSIESETELAVDNDGNAVESGDHDAFGSPTQRNRDGDDGDATPSTTTRSSTPLRTSARKSEEARRLREKLDQIQKGKVAEIQRLRKQLKKVTSEKALLEKKVKRTIRKGKGKSSVGTKTANEKLKRETANITKSFKDQILKLEHDLDLERAANIENQETIEWYRNFSELVQYQALNGGSINIPKEKKEEYAALLCWCSRQKMLYYKQFYKHHDKDNNQNPAEFDAPDKLNDQRVALLSAIGFQWDLPLTTEDRWKKRIKQLLEFKEEFGHFKVPKDYKTKDNLGYFVESVLKRYRNYISGKSSGTLTAERIEELRKIGFPLTTLTMVEVAWEERFNELVDYRCRFGHCSVPQHWPENKNLGTWVNSCRKQYVNWMKNQRPQKVLTPERIKRLDELGFVWKVRDRFFDRDWEKRLQDLREYKGRYGDCDVPPHPWEGNKLLSRWVERVRLEYKKYKKERDKSKLNEERIMVLDEMGFYWNGPELDMDSDEEN